MAASSAPTLDCEADVAWLRSELDRYSYKAGYEMQLLFTSAGRPQLAVDFYTRDSRSRYGTAHISLTSEVHEYVYADHDPDVVARWLRLRLHELERHESDEWLRRDDVLLFDPHEAEVLP